MPRHPWRATWPASAPLLFGARNALALAVTILAVTACGPIIPRRRRHAGVRK